MEPGLIDYNKMDIKIKKAKLTKSGTVEATYIDADGNEITIKGNNVAHKDLKSRLAELVPYFAELTEQKEADSYDWENEGSQENADLIRRLDVTGVSLGGDDHSPVAVLIGRRNLMSSKVINLNTPPTDLNSDENAWKRADDFRFAIDAFFYEVQEYIIERKWDVRQTEIDFGSADGDPFANAESTADVPAVDGETPSNEISTEQVA